MRRVRPALLGLLVVAAMAGTVPGRVASGAEPVAPAPIDGTEPEPVVPVPAPGGTEPEPVVPVPAPGAAEQPARGSVEKTAAAIPGQYIVTLEEGDPAWVGIRSLVLADLHGGDVQHVYDASIQGFSVRLSMEDAEALAAEPGVAAVAEDGEVHTDTTQANPPSWGLDRIDETDLPLDNGYSYSTGAPTVHAYVLDAAVRLTHQDFGGRATSGWDFVDDDPDASDNCAVSGTGHGTHVAGTLGGTTYGVAKRVQIVAVRVLGCGGSGSFSDVLAGVDWVTAHAVRPAVVNMSLGSTGVNAAVEEAIQASVTSGITYVVAAGNGGTSACDETPARVPEAVTVGATTDTDARSSFSNIGTCVDLFAPGTDIVSAWRTNDTATNTLSGTSMASPHVAGVAATYLDRNPNATPADVANAITTSATTGRIGDAGAGSPNLLLYGKFLAPATPDPPLLTAVNGGANGSVQLSWTTPIDGGSPITGYKVFRGTTPGGEAPVPIATLGAGVTGYTDSSVSIGLTYWYQVSAVNVLGEARSAEQSVLVQSTVSVVVRGADNAIWSRRSTGGTSWSAWQWLGGTITSNPAAVSAGPVLHVFARAADSALWTRRFDGSSWSAWQWLGGTITSDPAAVSAGPVVHVFARAADSALWTRRFDGSSWSAWQWLGGTITSDPAAVSAGPVVHVFARAADSALWTRRFDGSSWSAWQWLGGTITSSPAAVADSTGISVFARAADSALWTRRFDGSSWSPWQWLGGTITSDPAAGFDATGISVIIRAADNALWTRRSVAGGPFSAWVSLGGTITSNPAAVADSTGISVFARAADSALWTRRFDGSSWSPWQWLGGVVATSDPAGAGG